MIEERSYFMLTVEKVIQLWRSVYGGESSKNGKNRLCTRGLKKE